MTKTEQPPKESSSVRFLALIWPIFAVWLSGNAIAWAQAPNLNDIPNRLTVPEVMEQQPAAGLRVWQKLDAYRDWSVAHALYLPTDWQAGKKYPVIFEYPGNGGFKNALGDTSDGTVAGCRMGYGLCEGKQAIWVCLPLVDRDNRRHAINWWGDAEETVRYCKLAVAEVCEHWGGDRDRLLLCGFSRGALATSYIGLRDDEDRGAVVWLDGSQSLRWRTEVELCR